VIFFLTKSGVAEAVLHCLAVYTGRGHSSLNGCVNQIFSHDLKCQQEGNELKETASRAEELINKALIADPKNPLALHLHIHIAEASSPQR